MTMRFNLRTFALAAILSIASSTWLLADFEQELQQLQQLRDSGQITSQMYGVFTRQLFWKYNSTREDPYKQARIDGLNTARVMHAENAQQRTLNDAYRANTERLSASGEFAKSISQAEYKRAKTIDQLERTRDIRLDNDLKSVEVRYAMREVREAYVEQEREERRLKLAEARQRKLDDLLLRAAYETSAKVDVTQVSCTPEPKVIDASTGQIAWPDFLTQPSLRSWSDHLNGLLVANRELQAQARVLQLQEAKTFAKEIHEQVRRMRSTMNPTTFAEVDQFMITLRNHIDGSEKYHHRLLLRGTLTQGSNPGLTTPS